MLRFIVTTQKCSLLFIHLEPLSFVEDIKDYLELRRFVPLDFAFQPRV
jgi:hypothetical protein